MSESTRLYGLYGITDSALLNDQEALVNAVGKALDGGMRILQYRDKQAGNSRRQRQAVALRNLCLESDALFIINDDIELARNVDADGVHLGAQDPAIEHARDRLGADAIIGCSCYNRLELGLDAQSRGASYVAFGRFFPSLTKPQALQAEITLLQQARAYIDLPLCAIGGITTHNAATLIDNGASMVAVIHDLFAAPDIYARARAFNDLFA